MNLRGHYVHLLLCGVFLSLAPGPTQAADNVAGNLINFDNDGMWSWYMDERVIVDPANDTILISANSSSPVRYPTGRPSGSVDLFTYDYATGSRTRFQLSDIDEDDHNVPGLLILPDGRYLAMYANHGNNSGLGDEFSRWRRSVNPGDSTSWTTEQLFNWLNEVPGAMEAAIAANPDNFNIANVSYHNLFYLSQENQVYNISRSYGRLSTNGASQNMPNISRYDMDTNTVEWAGQLLESAAQGYSAYPKYASNGVDRIYFTTTETHPRNYNNSIYAGYIQNGHTFDMLGNSIDGDIFDNGTAAGGSGFVPDVTDFTLVEASDTSGAGNFRLWTVDMSLGSDGNPVAMYVSRYYASGGPGNGSQTTSIDHRIHYARWNGSAWVSHEIAQMGDRLYSGTDISEQDYTGNGALVPGDANTLYISTQYDPRLYNPAVPKTTPDTPFREIYKGVTSDGGASWTWTPVTSGSNVSNVRPVVPAWDQDHTAVVWMRGIYTTAQNTDLAIVGVIEQNDTETGLIHYVDATTSNTTRNSGAGAWNTGPAAGNGADDDLWHLRTGFGNNSDVFTSGETTSENAPLLKTTLSGLADGTYDLFAYFWAQPSADWMFRSGLDSANLQLFRDNGAQQAESGHFDGPVTLTADLVAGAPNPDTWLYRAYMGRQTVIGGSSIHVFVDDFNSSGITGTNRTWYDGLGYAAVTNVGQPGDFDGDGDVDGQDFLKWQADGLSGAELADWEAYYGTEPGGLAAGEAVPEPRMWALVLSALFPWIASRRCI